MYPGICMTRARVYTDSVGDRVREVSKGQWRVLIIILEVVLSHRSISSLCYHQIGVLERSFWLHCGQWRSNYKGGAKQRRAKSRYEVYGHNPSRQWRGPKSWQWQSVKSLCKVWKATVELREGRRAREKEEERERGKERRGTEASFHLHGKGRRRQRNCSLQLSRHLKSKCFIKLQSQLLVYPGGVIGLPVHQVSGNQPDGRWLVLLETNQSSSSVVQLLHK